MSDQDLEDFLVILAFLTKMERGSMMDRSPESILAELDLAEKPDYLATLDEEQKRRYNIYVEFYKINQSKGNQTMSDEEKDPTAVEATPEAAPAAEEPKAE